MELQQCTSVTMCMSMNGIVTQPPFCIICCQAYLAHVNCAHSVQGRLDQVLSTEICMKVVECVQIGCKLQVSILHPALDTLELVCWNRLLLTLPVQKKASHFGRRPKNCFIVNEFSSSLRNPSVLRFIAL